MRPSLPLAAALLAALAVPSSAAVGPACAATASTPTSQHAFGAEAAGSFGCDSARASLSVEVCLEVLDVSGWTAVACGAGEASNVTNVSATAYGCRYGATLIRSTARGAASTGESGYAASVPTAYYCTPL